jgi:hypothetical protein
MTFSLTEQESIRYYLGLPNHPDYLHRIAVATNALAPAQEASARSVLLQLAKIEQQIKNVLPFAAETFSSGTGGTRQYNQGQRLPVLKQEATSYVHRLGDLLNICPQSDVFCHGGGRIHRG